MGLPVGEVGDDATGRFPLQGFSQFVGDRTQKHGLGQIPGVVEIAGCAAVVPNGFRPLAVMPNGAWDGSGRSVKRVERTAVFQEKVI